MIRKRTRCLTAMALATLTTLGACTSDEIVVSRTEGGNVVASATNENVTVEVTTTRLAAETGEPIELMVTIKAPPDAGAKLIVPEDGRLGDFDILSSELAADGTDPLSVAERRRILISTFESGSVRLPGIETRYGTRSSLVTEPVSFEISSLVEGEFDPSDFNDIRGPVDDLIENRETFWTPTMITATSVGGVIGILAIALALGRGRRTPPRIPHEWALAELARIENEGLAGDDDATERYERIESVLRWYVAFRFGIAAPDRTSNELVEAVMSEVSINDDARAILERIVRGGDRVKFAGGVASAVDCRDALSSTREFVRETTTQTEDAS